MLLYNLQQLIAVIKDEKFFKCLTEFKALRAHGTHTYSQRLHTYIHTYMSAKKKQCCAEFKDQRQQK